MKILTLNFLTCAVRACKTSPAAFPLRCKDAALEQQEIEYNEAFLRNVLPRVEWDALRKTATEVRRSDHKFLTPSLAVCQFDFGLLGLVLSFV